MVSKTRRNRHRTRKGGSHAHTKSSRVSRLNPDSVSRHAADAEAKGKEAAVKAQAAAKLAEKQANFARLAALKANGMAEEARKRVAYIKSTLFDNENEDDQPYEVLIHTTGTYSGSVKNKLGNLVKDGYGEFKGIGKTYRGEWKDNKQHGFGVFVQNRYNQYVGYVYEGEWKDGEMTGYGIFRFDSGDVYKGCHNNQQFDGYGVYFFISNSGFFKGEFKQDIKDGFGTYDSDNMSQSGLYSNDIFMVGRGTIRYVTGTYTGDLKCENKSNKVLKHGNGTYIYANGDVYEGQFKNNKQYGKGKLTKFDGTVEEGVWSGNRLTGTITYPPGSGLQPETGFFDTGERLNPEQKAILSGDDTDIES